MKNLENWHLESIKPVDQVSISTIHNFVFIIIKGTDKLTILIIEISGKYYIFCCSKVVLMLNAK